MDAATEEHKVYMFCRDFADIPVERQRRLITEIFAVGYGIKDIHGGLLTKVRQQLAGEPFVATSMKEAYVEALLTLRPERDMYEIVRGPVKHYFDGGVSTNTLLRIVERVRSMTVEQRAERMEWARALIADVESHREKTEPTFDLCDDD